MFSWWFFLPCLLVSGLAAYLILEGTRAGDYPWALCPLTIVLAPIFLAGVYVGAIALSGAVFGFLEAPRPGFESPSVAPGHAESTRPESTLEDTQAITTLATTPREGPASSSPSAPPSASPSASPAASPSAAPTASPVAPATASASASATASSASPSP